jgi:dTDP-4-amino-4,6-dideoxygalactose transaminase
MIVPFLDLLAHHQPMKSEIMSAIGEVIDQSAFAGGPFVARFEEEFARYCQVRHAIGVGNGTDALWLALLAHEVGAGDEVITVPNTFIATAEAISLCGARPIFVDIDETTYTMNPALLANAITPKTKAIIPVHLFGQMADMDPILAFARHHNLHVIEDACQAHGAEYKGHAAGSMASAGCFSFYPGKNLGAFGEAGAVVTNDDQVAARIRILRDHGQRRKYYHQYVGWNARMDGIQGAILRIKLRNLNQANDGRRRHAQQYNQHLSKLSELILPYEAAYGRHVYHVYAVRTPRREVLLDYMNHHGIGCGIHYPVPLHLQEAYGSLGIAEGTFPIAERCAREFLSLPMYPELRSEQIDQVASVLAAGLQ